PGEPDAPCPTTRSSNHPPPAGPSPKQPPARDPSIRASESRSASFERPGRSDSHACAPLSPPRPELTGIPSNDVPCAVSPRLREPPCPHSEPHAEPSHEKPVPPCSSEPSDPPHPRGRPLREPEPGPLPNGSPSPRKPPSPEASATPAPDTPCAGCEPNRSSENKDALRGSDTNMPCAPSSSARSAETRTFPSRTRTGEAWRASAGRMRFDPEEIAPRDGACRPPPGRSDGQGGRLPKPNRDRIRLGS